MRDVRLVWYRGKWAVSYHDAGGTRQRRSLRTTDRAAAEASLATFTRHASAPTLVGELWASYRSENRHKRVSEQMTYTGRALDRLMDVPIAALTVDHSREHIARRRKLGIGDGTIWTELGHLRTVMTWAEKRGLIDRAPYIERPRKPAPREVYITREQMRELIAGATAEHIRLFLVLAWTTAGRNQAILGLTWDRVDLGQRLIDLREPKATQAQKRRAVVPMNQTAHDALNAAQRGALSNYVVEYAGRRVASVKRGFAAACEAAGLAGITRHDIRRSAARHMAEAGRPMEEIEQFLGHSPRRVVDSAYARFSPGYLRKCAEALELDV